MHLFNYNPYSIVNERSIAKIDAEDERDSSSPLISRRTSFSAGPVGGADRDRTDDPLLAKQVLSQLSYSPRFKVRGQKAEGRTQTCFILPSAFILLT
jgi:hypothetical protein